MSLYLDAANQPRRELFPAVFLPCFANKEYVNFRKKGIHPDIETKNDTMFGQAVATGEFCYTSAVPEEPVQEMNAQYENYEPRDENMESSRMPSSSRQSQHGKRKTTSSGFKDSLSLLATSIHQNLTNSPGSSVKEVMTELRSLPGIERGSELYFLLQPNFDKNQIE